jgi:hypothetical protein
MDSPSYAFGDDLQIHKNQIKWLFGCEPQLLILSKLRLIAKFLSRSVKHLGSSTYGDVLDYEQDMSRFCIRTRLRKMPPSLVRLRFLPHSAQRAEKMLHLPLLRKVALHCYRLLLVLLLVVVLNLMMTIPAVVVALMALELVEWEQLLGARSPARFRQDHQLRGDRQDHRHRVHVRGHRADLTPLIWQEVLSELAQMLDLWD